MTPLTLNIAWTNLLKRTQAQGLEVSARGLATRELAHETLVVAMSHPILTVPLRKVGFKAMAAEAAWILQGSNRLDEIEPYLPKMADFSDDGTFLKGAYGPRFRSQLAYVVEKLVEDPETRQATLTTWHPNPVPSKDLPCTVALDFKLRHGALNCHVFMRSSDQWLGIPYDVFSFTMMAMTVLGYVNRHQLLRNRVEALIQPGNLYLTAASSHLYESNLSQAADICAETISFVHTPSLPARLWDGRLDVVGMASALKSYRDGLQPFWKHHLDWIGG